ncbi:hypothetical protein A2415_03300 [candidate division WWE3 bacterium RIFOXYC1_FULL_39_7]|uniref:PhnB-like domain-containing protein n=2 Tax=Katanobacteria TaxID=422282 RepID=A0A1F4X3R3_UNCKA|nr:MAG: hypothetical protein A2415_03300 [candidate division WWE3 bacterium RIFOXYC1_FULL_39_7]OGC76350.1 MAG: hypothetical protein A2619_00110 [candidate division WWE3 bacterium RIFOXYD1_FULL_39_9]
MQKIIPHLWFDKEAKEAAEFYVSVFKNSKVNSINTLHDTPSGSVDIVSATISNFDFVFLSAGPHFKINPSISFIVILPTPEDVEAIWNKISVGGTALMELGEYPFSKKYGWIQDRYGVSWQIIFMEENVLKQDIVPTLMFTKERAGKAEEAINFYASIFKNSEVKYLYRYEKNESPEDEGTIKYSEFILEGQYFSAMDSKQAHEFVFNEATSFMVNCDTQEEIDYYWNKLSAVPEAEQCGWLKDKYGVSWQIVPSNLDDLLNRGTPEQVERVTQAFLMMKKFDLAELDRVYKSN